MNVESKYSRVSNTNMRHNIGEKNMKRNSALVVLQTFFLDLSMDMQYTYIYFIIIPPNLIWLQNVSVYNFSAKFINTVHINYYIVTNK